MIGYLLNQLITPEEEDRILCTAMRGGAYTKASHHGPCLVGTLTGMNDTSNHDELDRLQEFRSRGQVMSAVEPRYDHLCIRFGTERLNNAIRNRILDNRVKKALKGVKSNEQRTLAECG